MKEPVKTIRDTDEEARRLARRLIRGARFGAIGVLEPGSGFPFTSRVLTGTDVDGTPVILVSALSVHTSALVADPRASLLFGEPGKGDPLAHPRITMRTRAEKVARDDPEHARLRARLRAVQACVLASAPSAPCSRQNRSISAIPATVRPTTRPNQMPGPPKPSVKARI